MHFILCSSVEKNYKDITKKIKHSTFKHENNHDNDHLLLSKDAKNGIINSDAIQFPPLETDHMNGIFRHVHLVYWSMDIWYCD